MRIEQGVMKFRLAANPMLGVAEPSDIGLFNIETVFVDNNNNCQNQGPYNRNDVKNSSQYDKCSKGTQHT